MIYINIIVIFSSRPQNFPCYSARAQAAAGVHFPSFSHKFWSHLHMLAAPRADCRQLALCSPLAEAVFSAEYLASSKDAGPLQEVYYYCQH